MDPFGSLWEMDPFRELDILQRRLDRLYSQGGQQQTPAIEAKQGSTDLTRAVEGQRFAWRPHVDVKETDKEIVLHADVPGVAERDLNVSIDNGLLTVSGKREATKKEENERFFRMERNYGSFSRSVALPEGVDPASVSANFEHGVLEVRVPKPQTQQAKRITVNVAGGGGGGRIQQQQGRK